jgi:hypothetical protein
MFIGTGPKTGTFSMASTGTCAGTFARTSAGVAPTEDWTYKANWNVDRADWLDQSKGNLYRFEFAYLGYGPLNYYVMHPTDKRWRLVHQVNWPNGQSGTNFANPNLRPGWAAASIGGTGTNARVYGASAMAGTQGIQSAKFPTFAAYGTNSSISTETQILTMQVRREYGGKACNAVVRIALSVATDSTKGMVFRVYKNPVVAGTTIHQYIDQTESVCAYDSGGTTVSGGQLISAICVGSTGDRYVSFDDLRAQLTAGDEVVVTGQVLSGAASSGFVTLVTEERH